MKGYPSLTPEQKGEIIGRIKERGERVADLAKEYGVQPRIIYGYLSRSGQNSGALLELSKLKREKEALLKIIGELIADQKIGKKSSVAMAINLAAPPKSKKELARELGISRQSLYYKPKLPEKDLKLKAKIENATQP